MKKVAAIVLATAMTVPLITGCGAVTVPEESTAETTVKELGPARAQDDYYRFVNQERFDTSEFEYGSSTVEIAFKIFRKKAGVIYQLTGNSGVSYHNYRKE